MDVLDAGLGGLPGRVLGAYEEAAGRFDSFAFVPGEIPLSTGRAAAIAVAAYLCTIATLKRARKDAKPRKLTTVFVGASPPAAPALAPPTAPRPGG